MQYLCVFMFSHSQHAGTCILSCTLPHSPLTLSITLPIKSYAYNDNNDACAYTHTHTCTHTIPLTSTTFTGLVTTTVPGPKMSSCGGR